MSLDPASGIRIANVVSELLEDGFQDEAGGVLRSVFESYRSGIIQERLTELSDQAALLAETGKSIKPNSAVMRALLADMDDVIVSNRRIIDSASSNLQVSGLLPANDANRQMALFPLNEVERRAVSASWQNVDPEVMERLVSFVETPRWSAELDKYGDDLVDKIKVIAIEGPKRGWGPIKVADTINNLIQGVGDAKGFPTYQAENMMRTLQMQSFRTAQTIGRVTNSDVLDSHIRVAALDDRTCLSCIALHGDTLKLEQRIDDHHQGRCTSIPVVKGTSINIESGETWWNSRSSKQQIAQAGEANYNALQSGAVTLRDYPEDYDDPVFGNMIRESSLKGILGGQAEQYYARNQ